MILRPLMPVLNWYRLSNSKLVTNRCSIQSLIVSIEVDSAGKTLIKVGPNEMAEADHLGVQIEHPNKAKSG
jgi:hypothetical protein